MATHGSTTWRAVDFDELSELYRVAPLGDKPPAALTGAAAGPGVPGRTGVPGRVQAPSATGEQAG